ncbi:uncharacterized protein L969DRAFT_52685 [Mixia osmundae IAM 14324]|uniref:Protein kinase domain-containing protein n=1 Tax=Mixia osmundae (strain CBS 9802 / IAM 14324 / JCM 22182 / KY 12970) TaxID=764103 RepID=G7E514_MIXOS|nr:uncharacterized protein L969DRAFT_52685 [Mixia osmundae IAM 14324]KEI37785.1 hypothetical protein L969DRAFT_52685 [Mixia osmundae IAM 14324]GAA97924.1 hypothetical protein E5Q_04604 [Mixia osmundae IAM 14324]
MAPHSPTQSEGGDSSQTSPSSDTSARQARRESDPAREASASQERSWLPQLSSLSLRRQSSSSPTLRESTLNHDSSAATTPSERSSGQHKIRSRLNSLAVSTAMSDNTAPRRAEQTIQEHQSAEQPARHVRTGGLFDQYFSTPVSPSEETPDPVSAFGLIPELNIASRRLAADEQVPVADPMQSTEQQQQLGTKRYPSLSSLSLSAVGRASSDETRRLALEASSVGSDGRRSPGRPALTQQDEEADGLMPLRRVSPGYDSSPSPAAHTPPQTGSPVSPSQLGQNAFVWQSGRQHPRRSSSGIGSNDSSDRIAPSQGSGDAVSSRSRQASHSPQPQPRSRLPSGTSRTFICPPMLVRPRSQARSVSTSELSSHGHSPDDREPAIDSQRDRTLDVSPGSSPLPDRSLPSIVLSQRASVSSQGSVSPGSTAHSAIGTLIQRKRRQASLPYYNAVSAPHSRLPSRPASPNQIRLASAANSPSLSRRTSGTGADGDPAGPRPILPKRMRSRHGTRAGELLSANPALSQVSPLLGPAYTFEDEFADSSPWSREGARSFDGRGEVIMTPTTEEWAGLGGMFGNGRIAHYEGDQHLSASDSSSEEEYADVEEGPRTPSSQKSSQPLSDSTATPRALIHKSSSSSIGLVSNKVRKTTSMRELHVAANRSPVQRLTSRPSLSKLRLGTLPRPPSPLPLSALGPADPHEYSACTKARNITSFAVQGETGKGAYGLVTRGRERGTDGRPTGPDVVIKYIIKQRILADCWKNHRVLGPIPVEIHVLDHLRRLPYQPSPLAERRAAVARRKSIRSGQPVEHEARTTGHPNICSMLDFFEDAEHYYLVMPRYGDGQDLFDYVDARPEGLPLREIRTILSQIADALAYLHERMIVHRDIKDENVILDSAGNVQLIDFGSAAYIREGKKFDTFSGTLDFAAPEVLRGERYSGKETDIWALGVLGFVLVCGECPFWNSEEAAQGLLDGTRASEALNLRLARRHSGMPGAAPLAVDMFDALDPFLPPTRTPSSQGHSVPELDFDEDGDEDTQEDEPTDDDPSKWQTLAGSGLLADAIDVVRRCLEIDPAARPTATQLCRHRFFIGSRDGWRGSRGWQDESFSTKQPM